MYSQEGPADSFAIKATIPFAPLPRLCIAVDAPQHSARRRQVGGSHLSDATSSSSQERLEASADDQPSAALDARDAEYQGESYERQRAEFVGFADPVSSGLDASDDEDCLDAGVGEDPSECGSEASDLEDRLGVSAGGYPARSRSETSDPEKELGVNDLEACLDLPDGGTAREPEFQVEHAAEASDFSDLEYSDGADDREIVNQAQPYDDADATYFADEFEELEQSLRCRVQEQHCSAVVDDRSGDAVRFGSRKQKQSPAQASDASDGLLSSRCSSRPATSGAGFSSRPATSGAAHFVDGTGAADLKFPWKGVSVQTKDVEYPPSPQAGRTASSPSAASSNGNLSPATSPARAAAGDVGYQLEPCEGIEVRHGGSQEWTGPLPTISDAARARKYRLGQAILRGSVAFPPEEGDLCGDAQGAVRSWARGLISGQQCLLRLERCSSVVDLLGWRSGMPDLSDKSRQEHAKLWAAGCAGLGDLDLRCQELQDDMERLGPRDMLTEACKVLGLECGLEAEDSEPDWAPEPDEVRWDWALRRLTSKARRSGKDPVYLLQLQIWHELARTYFTAEGLEDAPFARDAPSADTGEAGNLFGEEVDDTVILDWLNKTQDEIRELVKGLKADKLTRGAERLLSYAAQAMEMGARLRSFLEEWECVDGYRLLGISKGASRSEIRRAFYKKALLMHPDKGGDKAAFQELQAAYDEILAELDGGGEREDGEAGSAPASPSERQKAKEAEVPPAGQAPPQPASRESPGTEQTEEITEEHLAWMTKASLDAAEGAGECATEVLMHCQAVRVSIGEQSDEDTCREHSDVVFAATRALAEASDVVVKVAARMAVALPRCYNDLPAAASKELRAASEGVAFAMATCTRAAEQTTESMKDLSACFGDMYEAKGTIKRLVTDFNNLARAAKKLAVSALDAAELVSSTLAAAKCPGQIVVQRWQSNAGEEGSEAADDQDSSKEGARAEEDPDGDEAEDCFRQECKAPKPRLTRQAREAFEAQQALSTLLEALRMVQSSNPEVARLQSKARKIVQEGSTLPAELQERKERAFSLLAEFLDEAAMRFDVILRNALNTCDTDLQTSCARIVSHAMSHSFGFVLRSASELAVPLDARAQTLRAAIAFDPGAVQSMLDEQVSMRVRDSLLSALLESACTNENIGFMDPDTMDAIVADSFDEVQAVLQEALDKLIQGLQGASKV